MNAGRDRGTGRPTGPDAARAHRAELRALARALHPDAGGSTEAYLAAVAELDRRYAAAPAPPPSRWAASGRRRRVRRCVRALRSRLPRTVPLARRYARL